MFTKITTTIPDVCSTIAAGARRWNALGIWLSCAAILLAWAGTAYSQDGAMSPDEVSALLESRLGDPVFLPGEVIVKLRDDAEADPLAALAFDSSTTRTPGGEVLLRLGGAGFSFLAAEDRRQQTLEAVQFLQQQAGVEYAQPNYLYQIVSEPSEPSDTLYQRQWHYHARAQAPGGIGLPAVWNTNRGRREAVVAVLDTGIVGDHEDIKGSLNLLPGADLISDPFIAKDEDGRDTDATDAGDATRRGECGTDALGRPVPSRDIPDSWHGTHVAGTVGVGLTDNDLGVAGVGWEVSVVPVRVLGRCGGTTVDINAGIRWAAGLPVPGVPDNPNPARVVNLSLGGRGACSSSPSTQAAIDAAVAAGSVVVVAAGNEADNAAGYRPASCNNVVTVAAGDFRGHLVSRYSNFGDVVDLMAPGGDVRRDDNDDGRPDGVLSQVKSGYELYNGTSMAAPHVAGVAALLFAQNPELTPAEVERELVRNALPRSDVQCPRPCGAGLLDATFLAAEARDEPGEAAP